MITRLRVKIVAVTMLALALVFAAVFVMLNLSMRGTSARRNDMLLEEVANNDGLPFPRGENPWRPDRQPAPLLPGLEMMRSLRFFYAKADVEGEIFEINYDNMLDFSRELALEYAQNALSGGKTRGTAGFLQYLVAEKSYGKIIVFAETSVEMQLLSRLMVTSTWLAAGAFAVLLALSVALSVWATAPVKSALDRQRRFISDAGHELKTPLTAIGANIDVLENEIGPDIRLDSMRGQVGRMGGLVHDLLTLARLDEVGGGETCEFDLSRAVLQAALELESLAFEEGRQLVCNVEPGIALNGSEARMRQLTAIFIDNAIRYSDENGMVKVELKRVSGRPVLSVFNTGEGLSSEEINRVFDRFYRSDLSRSRDTGGYGLGLAIAWEIVKSHRGKISVTGEKGKWIKFYVSLQ